MGKRPTINDIATRAGCSKTAVSFAFNNPDRIGKETRRRILTIADELGYIPNPAAKKFTLQKHMAIGFLLPQDIRSMLENPYIHQILEGIGGRCQDHGYALTLLPPINNSVIEAIKNASVDGVITMGAEIDEQVIKILALRHIPFVTIDSAPRNNMPAILIDDEMASYTIMRHVLERGHKEITIIGLNRDFYSPEQADTIPDIRMRGFQKALDEFNIPEEQVRYITSDTSFKGGKEAGRQILSREKKPTCIVAMSDITAIGCLAALKAEGIDVPNEISITGFDNNMMGQFISPSLTTVDHPAYEKGDQATSALFTLIEGKKVKNLTRYIPFSLIERESVKDIR